jgi:hypothetical protein
LRVLCSAALKNPFVFNGQKVECNGLANFYSSNSGNIKGLRAKKLGIEFFGSSSIKDDIAAT